jgi:hypothetical protein
MGWMKDRKGGKKIEEKIFNNLTVILALFPKHYFDLLCFTERIA